MNIECRICLNELTIQDENLQCSDILCKISICFGQDIIVNDLPQTICNKCRNKVEDIYTFRQIVIQNQNILLQRLETKCVSNKCGRDTKINIKLENKENEILTENTLVMSEEFDPKEVLKCELNSENTFSYCSEADTFLPLTEETKKVPCENEKEPHLKEKLPGEQVNIYDTNIYRCLTCTMVTSTQNELINHYKKAHVDKCHKNKVLDPEIQKYDVVTAGGCAAYKCKKCEKLFDSKRKINRHTLTHVQDRPFLCKLCGRTYKTVSEIVRHERAHSDVKTPCKHRCGFSTAYLGALKEHERRHNKDQKFRYKCDKCGKGFQVSTQFEQHQNIHTGAKPFVCEICGVAFYMDRYLKAHMSNVHLLAASKKRYICIHCSKPLPSKNALTLHLKEHGVTKKFLCDHCGKELADDKQFRFHKRMHVSAKPYSCSTCNKTFKRRFNLRMHARTHTGEREHACARCEKTYTQRSTLLRHLKRQICPKAPGHIGQIRASACKRFHDNHTNEDPGMTET